MSHTSRALHGLCLLALGVFVGRWTATIATASAQAPSKKDTRELLIGNVPIRLADPKDSVLAGLRKQYKVEDGRSLPNGTEVFFINMPDSSSNLGSVQFKQDRVVGVTRQWSDIEAPPDALMSFFQKIYGAFESASSQEPNGVVKCSTRRTPDGILTMVYADFGGRSASLSLNQKTIDGKPLNLIGVDESVSQQ